MGLEEVRGRVSYYPNMQGEVSKYHPPPFVETPMALHFQCLICTFLNSNRGYHIEQQLPPGLLRWLKSSSKPFTSHRTFHMLGRKSLENPTEGLIPPPPPHSTQTIHFQFLTSCQTQRRNSLSRRVCVCVCGCVFRGIWRLKKRRRNICFVYPMSNSNFLCHQKFLFQMSCFYPSEFSFGASCCVST